MASQYVKLPAVSGGGGGAVDSVFGRTGTVAAQSGDYSASLIINTPAGSISATDVQAAIDELDSEKQATITGAATSIVSSNLTVGRALVSDGSGKVAVSGTLDAELGYLNGASGNIQAQLDNKAAAITGNDSRIIRKNLAGDVVSDDTLVSLDTGELFQSPSIDVADGGGTTSFQVSPIFTPTEDAASSMVTSLLVNPTVTDNGFELGRNGTAVNVLATNFVHSSETDIGGVNLLSQNFSIGNDTDPVTIKGIGYAFGFGQINDNVTVDGPIQGYGFQPNLASTATMTSYMVAFYDSAQVNTEVNGYTSVNLSPNIDSIANNNNATIINVNPTISSFTGNSGANGVAVSGTYEGFGAGGINFISVNPTANDQTAKYAHGIWVSMDNVDTYPGTQSSLVFQDLTYTFNAPGDNNSFTLEYTTGGTAGSEVVTLVGQATKVQIESGVSTATQIKAAVDGTIGINAAITVTISGTGSNAQVAAGPTNFANGSNVGNKKAAYLDGDVEITGNLQLGGALSIGKLNAFAQQEVVSGSGTPASIHSLISAPFVGDNETVTLGDTIGINTAMLLTVGANSTVSSAFLGVAALALPAVVNLGTGSSVDQVSGGTFAISLQGGAAGTIGNLDLCRSLALPNGTTTVTKMSGYKFDLPFGNPATTTWGFYESPGVNNYLAGNLLLGGTAGSDDTVTNSSVALEIKSTTKTFVNARMSSTERDALTAINGMQIYNTTSDKLQVYAGGSWVDLH